MEDSYKEKSTQYKSKKCKAFHQDFFCPYGMRCKFIHEDCTKPEEKKNFFGMNFLLLKEPGQGVCQGRLSVFQNLSEDSS